MTLLSILTWFAGGGLGASKIEFQASPLAESGRAEDEALLVRDCCQVGASHVARSAVSSCAGVGASNSARGAVRENKLGIGAIGFLVSTPKEQRRVSNALPPDN
ncbi:hypothetical protein [Qipengyuania seohaensis]|uniref:hypothetical protein n=1 Tax=Qipengyuania seohaensis TaxID=266951 RepID=UPI000C222B56|nr:hypothetical protein [Qipengyuania seohaensis]